MAFLKRLAVREEGVTTVEYALLIVLLASFAVTAIGELKTSINSKFTSVSTAIGGS